MADPASGQSEPTGSESGRSTPVQPNVNPSRRGAIAGLLIAAAMLGFGLWLAHSLTSASRLQDCLMSGRTNCNTIEPAR
ncbi:hypothetical protein [Bradyrhizobium sp. STM 3557]|uniref:hypothetical protein n=1 Tax=Bradyrhizobium sp. STM 3557 TaxID=578920 RepID=UPI00388F91AA